MANTSYPTKEEIEESLKAEEPVPAQRVGIQEPNPYYNALLSIVAIVQETGECDDDSLQACLQAEGIGEFYVYAQTLLAATAGEDFDPAFDEPGAGENFGEADETGADPANPEQENDAEPDSDEPGQAD